MESQGRTRSCFRDRRPRSEVAPRGSKQICIAMTRDMYDDIWHDAGKVRLFLRPLIEQSPELFPPGIVEGYQLTGHLPESVKMPGIRLRQLRVGGETYSLRPSFVMSYMTGTVEQLEYPLLLLSLGVPFSLHRALPKKSGACTTALHDGLSWIPARSLTPVRTSVGRVGSCPAWMTRPSGSRAIQLTLGE